MLRNLIQSKWLERMVNQSLMFGKICCWKGREGGYSEHFVAEFIKDIKYLTIKEQFLIIDVMIIFFFKFGI